MIAVIFEVWPAAGRKDDYLDLAHELRAELDQIDGFVSVERFESIYEPGKYLALSFFRDEAAVTAWRYLCRLSPACGRSGTRLWTGQPGAGPAIAAWSDRRITVVILRAAGPRQSGEDTSDDGLDCVTSFAMTSELREWSRLTTHRHARAGGHP